MDYRATLIDSREGVNLTIQEAKQMASVIAPLLKQGQSPYQIKAAARPVGTTVTGTRRAVAS